AVLSLQTHAAVVDHELDALLYGGPEAKAHRSLAGRFGAEGHVVQAHRGQRPSGAPRAAMRAPIPAARLVGRRPLLRAGTRPDRSLLPTAAPIAMRPENFSGAHEWPAVRAR